MTNAMKRTSMTKTKTLTVFIGGYKPFVIIINGITNDNDRINSAGQNIVATIVMMLSMT